MRKLILGVNASLDGFMGGVGGDMTWMVEDEEMDHDFTTDIRQRADTMLAGRATYQSFEGAWPAMAESSSLSPELAVFAEWMLTTPIVVFSHGEPALGMSNARLATLPLVEEVAKLKDQPGRDLVVFGGATIVQELVRLGLVDEYWLKVEPVAIGQGLPVFGDVDSPVDLTLVWHKVYRSGVVGLRYEAARSSDEIVRSRWTHEEKV